MTFAPETDDVSDFFMHERPRPKAAVTVDGTTFEALPRHLAVALPVAQADPPGVLIAAIGRDVAAAVPGRASGVALRQALDQREALDRERREKAAAVEELEAMQADTRRGVVGIDAVMYADRARRIAAFKAEVAALDELQPSLDQFVTTARERVADDIAAQVKDEIARRVAAAEQVRDEAAAELAAALATHGAVVSRLAGALRDLAALRAGPPTHTDSLMSGGTARPLADDCRRAALAAIG